MADLAKLTSVYNHYLTSYAPKSSSSLDTHKKSELRGIYNSIVKINKESPLFLLDDSKESKAYAIGLKEDARSLQHTLASLGGLDEETLLNKKGAYSSDESIATVNYIGDATSSPEAPTLSLEVKALASPQENEGKLISSDEKIALPEGTYSFDIGISDLNYEFQFQIRSGDTNLDVQERLQRLINNADIGLNAEVTKDDEGNSGLKLTSQKSGLPTDKDYVFRVSDDQTSKSSGVVDYFGIGNTTKNPSNAEFVINGMEHSASSNTFTVEKMYELTLNKVTPEDGKPTTIGIKTDTESLMENMRQLFNGYNQFLRSTIEYTEKHPKSNQLVSEMWHIAGEYASPLAEIGVSVTEDGSVNFDESAMQKAIEEGTMSKGLSDVKNFAKDLFRKSNQVSLNPMAYVDKTIVAYKNPGKNFATPYITSAYSGMMFNSYC